MTRPPIHLLESRIVDQIAAGEVVERPASVVKELVENALDAGARRITVTLADGGRTHLRVEDDGHGMSESEALLAIERHATSKLRVVTDLDDVRTLGFRGEALPSIAAVSRFQLVTRPHDSDAGTRIRMDAGTLVDVRPVGASPGTVVDVRDLFHTLPARKAFLRSPPTELGHAAEAVRRIALARPETAFEVRGGERVLLRAPVAADLMDRAHAVLGSELTGALPFEDEGPAGRVVGWWVPELHRATVGEGVHLYVHGRWVRDRVLRNAVSSALRERVPTGRSPLLLLDLRPPAGSVDVNVHPTKAEVRFRDPAGLSAHVVHVLSRLSGRPRPRPTGPVAGPSAAPTLFSRPGVAAMPPDIPKPPALEPPTPALAAEPRVELQPPAPAPTAPGPEPSPVRVLGLVRARFVVVEEGGGVSVYDAGRWWRRRQAAQAGPGPRLVVPVRVAVAPRDVPVIEAATEAFERLGLRVAVLSPSEVVVRSVPASLAEAPAADLLLLAVGALRRGADPRAVWGDELAPAPVSLALATGPWPADLRVGRHLELP